MYLKPSPITGQKNADGGFPSRVYSFFGHKSRFIEAFKQTEIHQVSE
jgi:hypothetical protein